jgi:hypothetical protein
MLVSLIITINISRIIVYNCKLNQTSDGRQVRQCLVRCKDTHLSEAEKANLEQSRYKACLGRRTYDFTGLCCLGRVKLILQRDTLGLLNSTVERLQLGQNKTRFMRFTCMKG